MSDLKEKFQNAKENVIGKTNEALGKATGSEETELKGKIQSKKEDIKDKFHDAKENVAKKINDKLDEKDEP